MIPAREPRGDYHSYVMTNATVYLGESNDHNHSDVDPCQRIAVVGLAPDTMSRHEVLWAVEDSLNVGNLSDGMVDQGSESGLGFHEQLEVLVEVAVVIVDEDFEAH